MLVAETTMQSGFEEAGNQAFRILAGYIFGNNRSKASSQKPLLTQKDSSEKIAMTAPVNQIGLPGGYLVQFTMPKTYQMDNLPTPLDNRVKLREVPARKIAVYSYSGSWSEERFKEKLRIFQEELKKDGINTIGEPVFARYNSPFRLWFLRRNEIWLELAK